MLTISLVAGCAQEAAPAPDAATDTTAQTDGGDTKTTQAEGESTGADATQTTKAPAFLDEASVRYIAELSAGVAQEKMTAFVIQRSYNDTEQRWEYSVSFRVDRLAYKILLDAVSGDILQFDKSLTDE